MLPPIRVLGVGSPFIPDDFGWHVIEQLAQEPALQTYIGNQLFLEKLDRPGVTLIDYFDHAKHVSLIDVMLNEKVPFGGVKHYCIEELRGAQLFHSSHGFGVQESIALAESLGRLPEQMDVVAVSIGDGKVHKDVSWYDEVSTALVRELAQCLIKKCELVPV